MFKNEIKKIMPKKLIVYPFVLVFVVILTLAFIPHYSCACGDEGNNQVANRSKLTHYAIQIIENAANIIRPIIN